MEVLSIILISLKSIWQGIVKHLSKCRPFLVFPKQLSSVGFGAVYFIKCGIFCQQMSGFLHKCVTIAIFSTWTLQIPTSTTCREYFKIIFCILVMSILIMNDRYLAFSALVILVGKFPPLHFALDFCLMVGLLKYAMMMLQRKYCRLWISIAFITSICFYIGQITEPNMLDYCVALLPIFFT